MTRRVLKWNVAVDDRDHQVGSGPVVLVACQHDPAVVQVWTDEPAAEDVTLRLARVFGTGQPVPAQAVHLGSIALGGTDTTLGLRDVPLVWHVYGFGPGGDR